METYLDNTNDWMLKLVKKKSKINACILFFIYFILSILSVMLIITKQILLTIKNSNKMLIDVNILV